MGDSAHTTHHTTPGMTHRPQIYTSKYLRDAKKNSTLVDRVSETVSIYLEKTGPGNFLPYVNLETMGHQNDPSLISERTVVHRPTVVYTPM